MATTGAGGVTVGEVQVDVNADFSSMQSSLGKAQAEVGKYAEAAKNQFLTVNNAIAATTVAFVAHSAKAELATIGIKSMTAGIANLGLGLKNVLGLFGQLGVATLKLAERNPRVATAAAGALLGHPVLGVSAALLGTRVGTGIAGAAGFALRRPVAAAALGVGGGLLGIAAVGAAAAAGAGGFNALKDAFNEARKSSSDLQEQLDSLKNAAEKLSTEVQPGEMASARLRRLGGVTGGLTSPFAVLAGGSGQVSSNVIKESSDALEELTLRFGDQERASQALAQALQNPAKAMRLLRDAGIEFTVEQRRLLEGTRTFEDRLRNAAKVIEIINQQTPQIKKSGFIEFMESLGKFAAQAPAAVKTSIVDSIKALGAAIIALTPLSTVIAGLDAAFRRLGDAMSAVNKRFFPANAAEEISSIKAQIEGLDAAILKLNQGTAGLGGVGGIIEGLTGGAMSDMARKRLEDAKKALLDRQAGVELNEAARLAGEQLKQAELLNEKLQDNIQARRDELRLMQAANRQQLEAHRLAAEHGVDRNDPRIQTIARLNVQIEERRRIQAQAGTLTVFERENIQLQHQVQLFRYGNEEMEIRGRLLQIELQAAQRKQPLTEAQKQQLLEQMKILKEIQRLTTVVNDATSAVFNSMGDALAQFATTGKFKFKEMADSIIQQLVRIALQAFVIKPIIDAVTGFANPLIGSFVSPGSTTTAMKIPKAGSFAEGGSFTVPGGRGGGDKPYLIGLSAGESVDVTPGGKPRGDRMGGAITVINNVNSSKDFEVTTKQRKGDDGRTIVEQTFNEVMKRIGRGDGDNTFGARYGMRPRTLQR